MAAVDFLPVQTDVDPEKIGIIGICGWGGGVVDPLPERFTPTRMTRWM